MTREEAIRKVRCELSGLPFDKDVREAFETLIPELKPDDETTRNEILAYIGSRTDIDLETHNRWCSYLEKQKEQKPEGDDETESQEERDDRSFILDLLEEQLRRCKKNREGAILSRRIRSAMDWIKSMHTENAVDEEDEKVRKWLLEYFHLHRDDLRGASATSMEILSFLDNHPGNGKACDVDEFSLTLRNCLSADSELTDEQADMFARAYGEDLYKVAIGEMKSGADKYDIEEYRNETKFNPKPGEKFWVRCKTDKSENFWFDKGDERPAYAFHGKNGITYRVCFDKDGDKDSLGIWYLDKEWLFHDFDIVDEVDGKTDGKWPNLSNCKHDCRTCFARCFYRKEQNPELWKRITGNELD